MAGIISSLYVLNFTDLILPNVTYNRDGVSEAGCARLCIQNDCASFFFDNGRCYLSSIAPEVTDPSLVARSGVKCYMDTNNGDIPTTLLMTTTSFPPAGYVYDAMENLWFREVTKLSTWYEANQTCSSEGARLPKILTVQRNNFYKVKYSTLGNFWLGATDIDVEGRYVWTDGTPVTGFIDWSPKEPDGETSQNCMEMYKWKGKTQWYNGGCNALKAYICVISN